MLPSQGSGTDLLGNFNSLFLNVALYMALPVWLANNMIWAGRRDADEW